MLDALGQSLPIAVGLAVVSVPMAVVVLMLVTAGARRSVAAFILGWVAGIGIVLAVAITVVDTAVPESETSKWASIARIVLGFVLFGLAVKQWRSRPREGKEPTPPKWMSGIDSLTPLKALGLAFLLAAVNPKNAALAVAGGAAIAAETDIAAQQAAAAVVFTIVASIAVASPVAVNLMFGERAASMLESAKAWMAANNAIMMTAILTLLGTMVLGEGLSGLG